MSVSPSQVTVIVGVITLVILAPPMLWLLLPRRGCPAAIGWLSGSRRRVAASLILTTVLAAILGVVSARSFSLEVINRIAQAGHSVLVRVALSNPALQPPPPSRRG